MPRRRLGGRWLSEYSGGMTWANDEPLERVLDDLPACEARVPYHRFYMAAAESEYRANEWPCYPLLRDDDTGRREGHMADTGGGVRAARDCEALAASAQSAAV